MVEGIFYLVSYHTYEPALPSEQACQEMFKLMNLEDTTMLVTRFVPIESVQSIDELWALVESQPGFAAQGSYDIYVGLVEATKILQPSTTPDREENGETKEMRGM